MNTTAAQRLEKAREAKGVSLAKAWSRVHQELGPLAVSSQQIRNYELGKVPEDEWNPLVIKVLAEMYGKPVSEISELAANETSRVLVLLGGRGPESPGGDDDGTIDLRNHPSRCRTTSPDQELLFADAA